MACENEQSALDAVRLSLGTKEQELSNLMGQNITLNATLIQQEGVMEQARTTLTQVTLDAAQTISQINDLAPQISGKWEEVQELRVNEQAALDALHQCQLAQ